VAQGVTTLSQQLREALRLSLEAAIKASRPRKYVPSVELIVYFKDYNPKQPEYSFKDAVYLPHGLGEDAPVCVVADGDALKRASEAGAFKVLSRDELAGLSKKEARRLAASCDWILVRADLMATAGRVLGPFVGPRGKTFIPVPPSADIAALIQRYKRTTRLFSKDQPFVAAKVGKASMPVDDIVSNIIEVLNHIENKIKKPLAQSVRIYVKTTSSPAIEVLI